MKRLSWFLICLMIPSIALAANEYAVAKRVEVSMVVTGWMVVNPDGSVNSYTLDKQDKLPPEVVKLIAKTVPAWKFQPILIHDANDRPELAKAAMSLRVVARPLGDSDSSYELSVDGASFGKDNVHPNDSVTYAKRTPPRYPRDALMERVSGTVYLVLRVDRNGQVEQVAAEQVDLRAIASDDQMRAWRYELTRPAIAAAKEWTFNVPRTGKEAQADHWFVRVPINFQINYKGVPPRDEYGQWQAYVPGPVNQIPWMDSEKPTTHGGADAISGDGIAFQDDRRFVLLNPPGNG
jgi:hypothetical protein